MHTPDIIFATGWVTLCCIGQLARWLYNRKERTRR